MTGLAIFLIWLVSAFTAGAIGRFRGRWGLGVTLGLTLGPLGVLIIALVPKDYDDLARQEAAILKREARERQLRADARGRLLSPPVGPGDDGSDPLTRH